MKKLFLPLAILISTSVLAQTTPVKKYQGTVDENCLQTQMAINNMAKELLPYSKFKPEQIVADIKAIDAMNEVIVNSFKEVLADTTKKIVLPKIKK